MRNQIRILLITLLILSMFISPTMAVEQANKVEISNEYNIKLGLSEETVIAMLGQPDRKDYSEYNYIWYVYNKDIDNLIMVGIENNEVVALYTTSSNWVINNLRVGQYFEDTYIDKFKIDNSYESIYEYEHYENIRLLRGILSDESRVYNYIMLDSFDMNKISSIFVNKADLYKGKYVSDETVDRLNLYKDENLTGLIEAFELEQVDITNAYRSRHNLKPLQINDKLNVAARKHSQDMVSNNYFSHTNLKGKSSMYRAKMEGFNGRGVGENISGGYANALLSIHGLYNSEGHRKNILRDKYTKIGTGFAYGPNYMYNPGCITQDFGI